MEGVADHKWGRGRSYRSLPTKLDLNCGHPTGLTGHSSKTGKTIGKLLKKIRFSPGGGGGGGELQFMSTAMEM